MNNETNNLKVRLIPTLNRGLIYTAFPTGTPVPFTILFNKQTSALQFGVDTQHNIIRSGDVKVSMFRNLTDCKFCKTFFHLESTKDDNFDYRFKFTGTNRLYERDILKFSKEKLDLHIADQKKSSNNYLLILGWKLYDLADDLIFYFVQRRCYNNISRVNILRTMGLQFATQHGLDTLDRYYEDFEEGMHRVEEVSFLDHDSEDMKRSIVEGMGD